MGEAIARVRAGEPDPACPACGGVLKSATVFFGQPLDPPALDAASQAAWRVTCFIAVGTSLTVHPVAGLVPLAAAAPAFRSSSSTRQPTPYDDLAAVVVREPIGSALPAMVERGRSRLRRRASVGRRWSGAVRRLARWMPPTAAGRDDRSRSTRGPAPTALAADPAVGPASATSSLLVAGRRPRRRADRPRQPAADHPGRPRHHLPRPNLARVRPGAARLVAVHPRARRLRRLARAGRLGRAAAARVRHRRAPTGRCSAAPCRPSGCSSTCCTRARRSGTTPLATLIYTSHFLATPIVAAVLWLRDRAALARVHHPGHRAVGGGLVTYVLFPAAPPWYAARDGVIGAGDPGLGPRAGSGCTSTMPATCSARGRSRRTRSRRCRRCTPRSRRSSRCSSPQRVHSRWRWLFALYPIAMGCALVYLGEHYVVDVVAGVGLCPGRPLARRPVGARGDRRRRRSPVRSPIASVGVETAD